MHISLTAEQEAQLSLIAAQAGKGADEFAREVFSRALKAEAHFVTAVEEGITAADRGEFIEEDEMHTRVSEMLQS